MAHVDVKTWWDNRETLNEKMLQRLLDELETLRTSARVSLSLEEPPLGVLADDHERKTRELIDLLTHRIQEIDQIIYQRVK